jgi:hypothetical protein
MTVADLLLVTMALAMPTSLLMLILQAARIAALIGLSPEARP